MSDAKSFNRNGKELLQAGQIENAIHYFTKAIELDSSMAEAYQNRSSAYAKLNRMDESHSDARTAELILLKNPGRERYTEQIEDLFGDSLSIGSTDLDKIDNLYDELFSDSASRGSSAKKIVVLEHLDSNREEVSGVSLFHPSSNEITVQVEGETVDRAMNMARFSCIILLERPPQFPEDEFSCEAETIEVRSGKKYDVMVPLAQNHDNGVFAYTVKNNLLEKYFFFPASSIRIRFSRRYLGEILVQKGLIEQTVFKRALEQFEQLKKLKLGHFIAKQAKINYASIDREIQKAYKANITRFKVGELLVSAGIVSPDQVEAAIVLQEKIQKKRIGTFLIEKGLLGEEHVYMGLAEKFRTPLIDLSKVSISKKAVASIPREVALKLRSLPLTLSDEGLVVATITPDVPVIKELLAKHSRQENIRLVLARPSQLAMVLKKIYQAGP